MTRQGSAGRFARIVETPISSDTIELEHVFTLNEQAPRNNLMDYFYFVDSTGTLVQSVTGSVNITFSPVEGIFQSIPNGDFLAGSALDENWTKPNGFGKAIAIKVTLTGITGATGFRGNITQSVD